MSGWLNCAALDVVAIHAYGTGDFTTSTIQGYVNQATAAGKKLLFQEWYARDHSLYYIHESIYLQGRLLLRHFEQQLSLGQRAFDQYAQLKHPDLGTPDHQCRCSMALLAGALVTIPAFTFSRTHALV